MTKIMFVCLGNICRSPMSEFVFKKMLADKGLEKDFVVCSSATSTEEIGNPVYPPAREELGRHGIVPNGKRAVQLKTSDYDKYDLFVCMDSNNLRNIKRIFSTDEEGKIKKLMNYTTRGGDVADPWYTDRFDIAYRDIEEGCRGLLESLKSTN